MFAAQRMIKDVNDANTALLEVGTEIANELAGKDSKFSQELMNEIQPFAKALANQVDGFQDELKAFKQTMEKMKNNNELYLGDLAKFYKNSTEEFT